LYQPDKKQADVRVRYGIGRYFISGADEKVQRFNRFFQFEDIRPLEDWKNLIDSLLPNINILSGIPMLNNFDPMVPDRFTEFMVEMETASPDLHNRYLALANVEYIASVDPTNLRKVEWNRADTVPRSRLVSCADQVQDGQSAMNWLKEAAASERIMSIIVVESKMPPNIHCTESSAISIESTSNSNLSTRQEYQIYGNSSDRWLFLADTWYPGWQAKLDGKPVEIYRADYVFMGIQIPMGDHQVEIEYRPISFTAGIVLSLIGLICVIVLGVRVKNSTGGSH
jgi:hypothetical protein